MAATIVTKRFSRVYYSQWRVNSVRYTLDPRLTDAAVIETQKSGERCIKDLP